MHIPLSLTEISTFLEVSENRVSLLWESNLLHRTVFHSERLHPDLAQSSIFDVLEFALPNVKFPTPISQEHAALWVSYLCEASEWSDWPEYSLMRRAEYLIEMACDDGIVFEDYDAPARVAVWLVAGQDALLKTCLKNDMDIAV